MPPMIRNFFRLQTCGFSYLKRGKVESAPLLSGLADPVRVYSLSELHVLDDARLRELQHYELRGRAERTKSAGITLSDDTCYHSYVLGV